MTERYAVIGNPVAHSKSPEIHAAFARATGQDIEYGRLLAPLEGFAHTVAQFRAQDGKGANVTVPFKEEAFRIATTLSARARSAGAVNTLCFDAEALFDDNTDGAGLIADLRKNLAVTLRGRSVLLVGAGGAARGLLQPLLGEAVCEIVIANRTAVKAQALAAGHASVRGCGLDELRAQPFDVVINATSASLAGVAPRLPAGLFAGEALAYDLVYAAGDTPFMAWARASGAARLADGLGMLVEQAAESFFVWRGVRPDTAPVLAMLRAAK